MAAGSYTPLRPCFGAERPWISLSARSIDLAAEASSS